MEDDEDGSDDEEEEEDDECEADVHTKFPSSATASTSTSAAVSGAASAASGAASSPPSEAVSSPGREGELSSNTTPSLRLAAAAANEAATVGQTPILSRSSSGGIVHSTRSSPHPREAVTSSKGHCTPASSSTAAAGGQNISGDAPASSSTATAGGAAATVDTVGGSGAAAAMRRKGAVLFSAYLTDYEVVTSTAASRGWRVMKSEEKADKCNILWIDKADIEQWLLVVQPWMRVNHFPGMNQALARKTRLARNMARMQRLLPKDYKFLPPTWVLPDQLGELQRRFDPTTGEAKSFYIVKPDHLCQGRGIFLATNIEKIKKCVQDRDEPVVVQQYISRPMLIDGLKFDLRLYFLVCGVVTDNGGLLPRCFLFRDGLVRLCTTAYQAPTSETMDNKCMHLTNYAINKKSSNFEQNSGDDEGAGSKRSLRWFLNYVEQEYGLRERQKLWQKLAHLCVKMILAVHPTLEAEYGGVFPKDLSGNRMGCRCFEILGVDVMLDRKRKPYLIEVNHLPSFTCDSPLDEDIKRRVLEQTLDLTCSEVSGGDKQAYEAMVKERADSRPKVDRARRGESADSALRGGYPSGAASNAPRRRPSVPSPSPRRTPADGRGEAWTAEASPASRGQSAEGVNAAGDADARESPAPSTPLDMECYRDFERVFPATSSNSTPKQAANLEKILERVSEVFRPVNAPRRPPKEPPEPPPGAAQTPPQRPPRPPGPGPGPAERRPRAEGASVSLSPSRAAARSRSAPGPGPPRCALVGLRVVERRLEAASRARSSSVQRIGCSTSPNVSDKPLRVALPLKLVSVTL